MTERNNARHLTYLAIVALAALILLGRGSVAAHNLSTTMVWMFFDPETQAMYDARVTDDAGYPDGTPIFEVGDEIGLVIKVLPNVGTTTGVGGVVDFFLPNGVTVLDAAYVTPDATGDYAAIAMKGQALMPDVGAGGNPAISLVGVTLGPNILGTTSPVVTGGNVNLGTLPAVYGDIGIFYATDPDTAYGSWVASGGYDGNPGTNDNTITNNRGNSFVPLNKWDAEQMFAYGSKLPITPIIDANGRGNAPWGLASVVAGPESGYAWQFDKDIYDGNPVPANVPNALTVGPWQRIQYPGSLIANDPPGHVEPSFHAGGADGSTVGYSLSPSTPLPATVDQSDAVSPKAVRWSIGQLTLNHPEHVWIKFRLDDLTDIVDESGCATFNAETFGGDAGGDDTGKDHLWRYYWPTEIVWNTCVALNKKASVPVVSPNQVFQYEINFYNTSTLTDLTNVVITDPLPGNLQYISAVPAPNSTGPLRWIVPSLPRGSKFEATVTVRATGTGVIENVVTAASDQQPLATARELTPSGSYAMLSQSKTVTPQTAFGGDVVSYTLRVQNIGSGASGNPVRINEKLPAGFTYQSLTSVTVNGASYTGVTTVNATNPGAPVFTVPASIAAGNELVLVFSAGIDTDLPNGAGYCNAFTSVQNGLSMTTGAEACVTVVGGKIGDTLYRDWDGDGVQDPGDEGLAGVTMELRDGACTPLPGPGADCPTQITSATGSYQFTGLAAGTYTVAVIDPPSGYNQTGDPDVVGPCGGSCDGQHTANLATDTTVVDLADFGYQPGGSGQIGNQVFEDLGNDGSFDPGQGDAGIANVTINLYEDSNGDGLIDAGLDSLIATTSTDPSGVYTFTNLAEGLSYLVDADQTDADLVTYFAPDAFQATTSDPQPVPALSGSYQDADFGFFRLLPSSIGDTIFVDLDGDGSYDVASDTPLPNVTVQLYRDLNEDGVPDPGELRRTTSTTINGTYAFETLGPGDYIVVVDQADPDIPAGLYATRAQDTAALSTGMDYVDADFPFVPVLTKAVDQQQAAAGDTLTYSIEPAYPRYDLLSSVIVTDAMPVGTTYAGGASPAPTSAPSVGGTGEISWSLGSTTAGSPGETEGGAFCSSSLTILATVDTYVREDAATNNYVTQNKIETRPNSNRRHALVYFDLSALPAGAIVDSATLQMVVTGARNNHTASLHQMRTAWVQGATSAATWNTYNGTSSWAGADGVLGTGDDGPFSGGDYFATSYGTLVATPTGAKSADVTALVNAWRSGTNRGMALIAGGTDNGQATWESRETGAETGPKLTVNYRVFTAGGCDPTSPGTGFALWSDTTGTPLRSSWDGATFGTPSGAAALAARFRVVQSAEAPFRAERIVVGVINQAANNVVGQRWNGSTWTALSLNPLGTASGATTTPAYSADVAYESESGDALLVWDDNTQPAGSKLRYAVWNGAAWTTPASISAYTGAEPRQIQLAPDPQSDRVIAVVSDVSGYDYALVWSGNAWGNAITLENSAGGALAAIGASFEGTSGEAIAIYAKTDNKIYYRTFVAGAWSGELSVNGPSGLTAPKWATLAANPHGNRLALGVVTTGKNVWLNIWSGSAWGASLKANTKTLAFADGPNVAVGFEGSSGDVLAAFGRDDNKLHYRTWTLVGGWSAEQAGPDVGQKTHAIRLYPRPADDEIMVLVQDDGRDLSYSTWDGAAFGTDIQLEDDTGETANQPFTFAWDFTGAIPPTDGSVSRLIAGPTLVGDGATIDITLVLTATDAITDVIATSPLTVTTTGAGVTGCAGPTLASADDDLDGTAADRVIFSYACTAVAGAAPGSVTFAAAASGTSALGGYNFAEATSNSVLIAPTLSFQVQIDDPTAEVVVRNTAWLGDSGVISPVASNPAATAIGASLGDAVWADFDGDGSQDPGEPGIGGVQVCADDGVSVACALTDASGGYRLYGLTSSATYTVTLTAATVPAGYLGTTTTVKIVAPADFSAAGGYITDADFGLHPPGAGSLGDMIWRDADEDGVLDTAEEGLPGLRVWLFDDRNADGIPQADERIATTTTDAAGNYLFTGLIAGDYLVQIDESSVVTSTYGVSSTLGAAMEVVSVAGSTSGAPPLTNVLALTLATDSDVISTADFGYNWSGAIGDATWYDADADDIQDPDELDAGLVSIVLIYDLNGNGDIDPSEPVIGVADSDGGGAYLFDNLPPGDYLLKGDESTVLSPPFSPNPGVLGTMVPTGNEHAAVSLAAGELHLEADFGFIEAALVEGHVFHDEDHNGTLSGEPGIESVEVTLTGVDITGSPVVLTTTTDVEGEYAFLVLPGDYTVSYNPADPEIPGVLTAQTTPTSYAFSITAGEERGGFDFGLDHEGAVGDTVFHDADGDGVQGADEAGLAAVTVSLFWDTNDSGVYDEGIDELIAVTATDETGAYLFPGLEDGRYFAIVDPDTVPLPDVIVQTADPDQAGACSTCDHMGTAFVDAAGGAAEDLDLDFGYQSLLLTHSVAGTVFDDDGAGGATAGDGQQTGSEPGLAGAKVTIVYTDTEGAVFTVVRVTDVNGDYSAAGIPTGADVSIDVDESTLSSPAYQPTSAETLTIAAIGADHTDQDFGYLQQFGSIAGTVCAGNGDSVCAAGEAPLASITVTLRYAGADGFLGTGDDVIATTQTLADGSYSFTGLEPGLHEITESNATGYESVGDADGSDPDVITVDLGVGQHVVARDFEDWAQRLAIVGNRVWVDENADGADDAGEPGLANVVVELYDATGLTLIMTTTTDVKGGYAFASLEPETYRVRVDASSLPAGLFVSNLGPNPGADGQNQAQSYVVTLASGEENLTADFGYIWADPDDVTGNTGAGAIGDTIFVDADGDGVHDPGEPGLAGVTVTLYGDPDGDGVYDSPVGSPTVTAPDGRYTFTGVPAGAYVVAVTPPAGYTQTGDPDGTLDDRTTAPIILAPGDVYLNADFGYQPDGSAATIGDLVWFDGNGDGVFNTGDAGIPGVTVALLDGAGAVVATTTTDENGAYQFAGLPDGDYTVWVNDTEAVLAGLAPTADADGTGTPHTSALTISGGVANLDQDFGYAPPDHDAGDGLIGDVVFLDRDGDGQPDAGEGIEGVTVDLYDATGTILLARTTTDENGAYHFGDLPAGGYIVRLDSLTLPAGGTGLTNTVDPDLGAAHEAAVTLAAGEVDLDQDFGYAPASSGAIAGTIWNDANADGLLDETGAGLAGITVVLRDTHGHIVASTFTDPSGDYSFANLPAGSYAVDVTDDGGLLQGMWHSLGASPGTDGNSQSDAYPVVLGVGGSNATADFGYYVAPGALGDLVWLDLDGDGVQEAGEPGLGGVPVNLVIAFPNGTTITVTTVTDESGAYLFDNLLLDEGFDGAGGGEPTYTVMVTTPPATTPSPTNQAAEDADSDDGVGGEPAATTQGATGDTYDFGYVAAAGADLGDLPNDGAGPSPDYPVQFPAGAAHVVFPDGGDGMPDTTSGTPAVWLGASVDLEADGQPSPLGNGDDAVGDDEDGLALNDQPWVPGAGQVITVTLNSSAPTTVNAGLWLDWDADGVFDSFQVFSGTTASPVEVPVLVDVPVDYALGAPIYLRVRAFAADMTPTAAAYQGSFVNGEVEDVVLTFSPTAVRLAEKGARPAQTLPGLPSVALAAVWLLLMFLTLAAASRLAPRRLE